MSPEQLLHARRADHRDEHHASGIFQWPGAVDPVEIYGLVMVAIARSGSQWPRIEVISPSSSIP